MYRIYKNILHSFPGGFSLQVCLCCWGGGGGGGGRGVHTCDKFQRGIREVFLSFPGGF